MRTRHYRLAGVFDLLVWLHGAALGRTVPPLEPEALERWLRALAGSVGLEVRALQVGPGAARLIASASHPGAVPAFARWVPRLAARPLHEVHEYFRVLAELSRPEAPGPPDRCPPPASVTAWTVFGP